MGSYDEYGRTAPWVAPGHIARSEAAACDARRARAKENAASLETMRPLLEAVLASVKVEPLPVDPPLCPGCGSVSCPTGGRCPDFGTDDFVKDEVDDGEPF
jgi:hypothetical protein